MRRSTPESAYRNAQQLDANAAYIRTWRQQHPEKVLKTRVRYYVKFLRGLGYTVTEPDEKKGETNE